MNILELIKDCEVEWKTLDNLAVVKTGQAISKQKISENQGYYPVINSGKEPLGYIDEWNTENDPIGVTTRGAGVGSITWQEGKYFRGNLNYSVTVKNEKELNVRFLYYLLLQNQSKIHSLCTFSGIPALNASELKKLELPVPKLEIQEKIVKTLDIFTKLEATLEATLEAELSLRVKQYDYYRNELLTFGDDVEWKTLGEIGEVRMCKRILKNQTSSDGEIPFYKIGTFGKEPDAFISRELFEEYKNKFNYPQKGEILISASGTIGRTVIFNGEDSYFQDSNIVWVENDEKLVLNKFLFYFYKIAKWGVSEGGTIQRLYNSDLKKLKIPLPPLSTQQKIVDILDKFDRLTNSISDGLPKEIELRRKQYEYYREQLLNFSK